jgi:hypothetical protein
MTDSADRVPRKATGESTYDVALRLLDRQVIDSDGVLVCNVDDLEVDFPDGGPPRVVALLTGPGVLGPRVGGFLGRWIVATWRRLSPTSDPRPGRIDIHLVAQIDSAIHLAVPRRRLADLADGDRGIDGFEQWVREVIIGRIPGAGHDPQ